MGEIGVPYTFMYSLHYATPMYKRHFNPSLVVTMGTHALNTCNTHATLHSPVEQLAQGGTRRRCWR